MSKLRSVLKWVSVPMFALALAPLASAQATRTWVSGVGDDVNPCSRTAPCKTFAGAISKTAAGGEISVLDPGGYGALTITKAITINGDGTLAGSLSAGTTGFTINAGINDKVVIRNVSINGAGTGLNGVRFLAGKEVVIENVTMANFTTRGVDVSLGATGGTLTMKNVSITNVPTGVRLTTTSGTVVGLLEGVRMNTLTTGLKVGTGGNVIARNCEISRNNIGVSVTAASGNATIEKLGDLLQWHRGDHERGGWEHQPRRQRLLRQRRRGGHPGRDRQLGWNQPGGRRDDGAERPRHQPGLAGSVWIEGAAAPRRLPSLPSLSSRPLPRPAAPRCGGGWRG